jgi:hypothetical protein
VVKTKPLTEYQHTLQRYYDSFDSYAAESFLRPYMYHLKKEDFPVTDCSIEYAFTHSTWHYQIIRRVKEDDREYIYLLREKKVSNITQR